MYKINRTCKARLIYFITQYHSLIDTHTISFRPKIGKDGRSQMHSKQLTRHEMNDLLCTQHTNTYMQLKPSAAHDNFLLHTAHQLHVIPTYIKRKARKTQHVLVCGLYTMNETMAALTCDTKVVFKLKNIHAA